MGHMMKFRSLASLLLLLASARLDAAPPPRYVRYFNAQLAASKAMFDSYASSTDGHQFYTLSLAHEAVISMWEATRDRKYIEQALIWAEAMIKNATLIDSKGYRNWTGGWLSPYSTKKVNYELDDFQGTTALARLSYLILTDPTLADLAARAQAVRAFEKREIVEKWFWARGQETWIRGQIAGQKGTNDKAVLAAQIVCWLGEIPDETDARFRSRCDEFVGGLAARLKPFGASGALAWDVGRYDPALYGYTSLDTSHANRWPKLFSIAYRLGRGGVKPSHLVGLSRLLTEVLWNKSLTSPSFANYIDGHNSTVPGEKFARHTASVGLTRVGHGWHSMMRAPRRC